MRLDTTDQTVEPALTPAAQLGPGRDCVSSSPRWTPAVKLVRKL
jgi:hypothetical protein